jgi:hypothetical protein
MQGTALRSQLRTNVPGHQVLTGTVTVASGVPAVGNGKQFTVGRGVLSLTVAASPTIVGAPNGTYTGVPVTTTAGSTAVCSLTVSGGAGVISAAAVTEPGYDYTAANAMSVTVGSLFWTASSLATGLTGLTAGTYFIPILSSSGSGMVARVVTSTTAVTSVTVNPTTEAGTAVGSGYGTSPITYSVPAGALYSGSPAIANAFVLTPNPTITVGTITPVITGNISVVYPGQVVSTVSAQATPIATVGDTAFFVTYRFGGTRYANFGTLKNVTSGTPNVADLTFSSATPGDGDGFAFSIVTTDTAVTV